MESGKAWMVLDAGWMVCMAVFGSATKASGGLLMGVVGATRVLLVLPAFARLFPVRVVEEVGSRVEKRVGGVEMWFVWLGLQSVVLVVQVGSRAVKEGGWGEVLGAVNGHPAISALGYDVVISLVAGCSWMFVRRGTDANVKTESRITGKDVREMDDPVLLS